MSFNHQPVLEQSYQLVHNLSGKKLKELKVCYQPFGKPKNPTIFNIIRWVDRLIDQASDGPNIILID